MTTLSATADHHGHRLPAPRIDSGWLTTVPAITATFWVITILSTTLDETVADFLDAVGDLHARAADVLDLRVAGDPVPDLHVVDGGRAMLAAMVAADVFAHAAPNTAFGPGVRIVTPGGEKLIVLED